MFRVISCFLLSLSDDDERLTMCADHAYMYSTRHQAFFLISFSFNFIVSTTTTMTTLTIKIIDKKPSDDRSMLNTSSPVSPTTNKEMTQSVKYKHSVYCDCKQNLFYWESTWNSCLFIRPWFGYGLWMYSIMWMHYHVCAKVWMWKRMPSCMGSMYVSVNEFSSCNSPLWENKSLVWGCMNWEGGGSGDAQTAHTH